MPTYTPPLRDMQFVMHEVLKVTDEFKAMPRHADIDAATIDAVLEEAGFGFEHLVSATVYLTDINTLDTFDAVWQEYFPDPMAYPSRAVVEVSALVLGIQLEISAIAIKD